MRSHIVILAIVLFALFSLGMATRRRHKGPSNGQAEKILRGRTLTSTDRSSRDTYAKSKSTARVAVSPGPRVVDFALHLRRDVVLWDEVKTDDVTLSHCHVSSNGKASFSLSGSMLEISDYDPGTVFVIDETDLETCSNRPTPTFAQIDPEDTQLFLSITSVHRTADVLLIAATVIPGRLVVPTVEIAVHESPEPRAAESMTANDEYEDEPHSDWAKQEGGTSPSARTVTNGTGLMLPTSSMSSRITLQNKVIAIGEGAEIELSVAARVRIRRFRLRRLRSLTFQWEQELSTSVSATLTVSTSLLAHERTGPVFKLFVPSLSFSVRVPVTGKVRVGGFVGLNWVSELAVSRAASVSLEAVYTKRQKVTASVRKLQFSAVDAGSSAKGTANIEVSPSNAYMTYLYGFYGVRPVVGMGVTYERRRLRRRGWKVTWRKERKQVNGNVGADLGSQLLIGHKYPPFKAFNGPGLTLGDCKSCHALQGRISLRGKDLGFQTVKHGQVESRFTLVRELFDVPLGTICAVKQTCLG